MANLSHSICLFLRISNLAPNSLSTFDSSRHLTPADVSIYEHNMKLRLKWSQTMQNRDKVHIVTLPRVKSSPLYPVKALQRAIADYSPLMNEPLFQINTSMGWVVVKENRIRKFLAKIIKKLGFPPDILLFTPSGAQGLPWLTIHMYPFKKH